MNRKGWTEKEDVCNQRVQIAWPCILYGLSFRNTLIHTGWAISLMYKHVDFPLHTGFEDPNFT